MTKHLLLLSTLLIVNLSHAQKLMQLPTELDDATPMQVRWKARSGVTGYEFGLYRVVNGKEKWVGTSTETEGGSLRGMLSTMRDVNRNIRSKRSFQLVNDQGATATVNMAITTVATFEQYKRGLLGNRWEGKRFEGAYTTWIAAIETPDTTQRWLVTAFQEEKGIMSGGGGGGLSISKTSPIEASMRNGDRELDVVPVTEYADNKKSLEVLGFVINENGKPLAAVQFRGPNPLKQHLQSFIWLSPSNAPDMQIILATSLTTLLAVGHEVYYSTAKNE